MVSGGCLHVEWLYSNNVHLAATIEARAQRFGAELQFLLQTGDAAKAIVDSDFPLAKIDHTLTSQLLTGGAVEDIWPLTPLQEGMLIHALHGGEGGVYCQQVAVDLRGQVNMAALHSAWRELARRHAVLRVEFRWQDLPVPHQIVRKDVAVAIAMLDWSIEEAGQLEQRFSQWLAIDRAAGFDLATAPLWRVTVIQLEHDRWKLVWTHHHLLLDGWSLPIVFEQLISEYAVACGGAVERQPAPFRYANYLQWLAQRDTSTEAAFWKAELAGYRPAAQLELGPAPLSTTPARATIAWELTPAATNSLRRLAQRLQITLGTCVQGVWGLVLARWTKKSEALFGLVVAGRPAELPGAETAVGMFINTLPLRIPVPRDVPVEQWLRELHQKTASLRQYEQSRLVDVQSWSEVPREQALFEAVLIIENYPLSGALGEPVGGVSFGSVDSFEQTSLPLNLYAVPGEKLELRLEYSQTRFRDDVMHSFAASISGLLEALPRHAGGTLPALPMLPPAALAELKASAGPPALAATGSAVHQRIAAQAVQQPDAIAIMGGAEVITYAELEAKSNQLAHYLIAKGAGSGALIGVYLERSPRMLIALLGIVKSGAAYVPMDPAFPMERLAMVVEDSKLAFVVMEGVEKQCGLFPASIQQVSLEADAASIAACATAAVGGSFGADELAYVIFTSGSTGRPKGVQVTHGALANFLDHFSVSPGLKQSDILLAVTTLSFDIAALELFLPLVCGARLVIASRETTADGRALAKLMEQSGITVMQGTPATWQILLASDWRPRGPFQAWCGGEALPMDLARELVQRGITLWNFYGPTETTIWSTTQLVAEVADAAFIGIPIKNTWAWVLDENLEPAPTGMTGELYLGGEGLARGYIGRPGLTAERFIPSPFGNGERLYATGDEARWESGVLRFLGRRDHQVKIRGFRVEIEDIEVALRAVPNVRGAAVAARNDHQGKPRLVAWVQGLNDAGGASALRARLLEALPEYMVPGTIVAIEALPMTPNGKLDRRALPDEVAAADAPRAFITPRDAIEQVLADLWQEVLGVERVGAEDHFFELGGHSLLAAQALGRIRKYFQVDVSLRTFFETATPAAVAVALKAAEPAAGRMLKIASALLRLRSMSDEERAILKRKAAQSAGAGRA